MKYTKQQRNKIYRKAYEIAYVERWPFICQVLSELTGLEWGFREHTDEFKKIFNEFALMEQYDLHSDFGCAIGYSDRKELRLTALAFMIAMTDSK